MIEITYKSASVWSIFVRSVSIARNFMIRVVFNQGEFPPWECFAMDKLNYMSSACAEEMRVVDDAKCVPSLMLWVHCHNDYLVVGRFVRMRHAPGNIWIYLSFHIMDAIPVLEQRPFTQVKNFPPFLNIPPIFYIVLGNPYIIRWLQCFGSLVVL